MASTEKLLASDPTAPVPVVRTALTREAIAYALTLGLATLLLETLPGGRLFVLLLWAGVLLAGTAWLVFWLHATADGSRMRMMELVRRMRLTVYLLVTSVALLMAVNLLFDVAGDRDAVMVVGALLGLISASVLAIGLIRSMRGSRLTPAGSDD